jgi:hypothetical protein
MKNFLKIIFICFCTVAAAQPTFTLPAMICEQNSLNVSSVNGTLVVTGYTWTADPIGPFISAPNSSATSITFPNAGAYTITLEVTDGISLFSYTNAITVNPLPNIIPSIQQGTPICPPPTQIGGLNMSASGATTYTWLPGGQAVQNVNIFPQPSSAATYTVVGTDANGCIGLATIFVPVHALPTVNASGPSTVCPGDNVCLNANGSLIIYAWQGPCGYTSSNPNDCFVIASGCGGTYNVGGTDINGCVNVAAVNIVVVNTVVTITSNPTLVCLGQSATLTAIGGMNHTWTPCCYFGPTVVITPTANINFSVQSVTGFACPAYGEFTLNISPCTSLGEKGTISDVVTHFPNPTSGKINFGSVNENEAAEILLQDISGRLILSKRIILREGLDISGLNSGIYFCEIYIGGSRVPQRIKFIRQ